MVHDDIRYRLFKLVEENPGLTQREAAAALGMSLGKTHYCLRALISKGWIKARNFRDNPKKLGYVYLLTPKGIEEKARVTQRFLERKRQEYEALAEEIRELASEVERQRAAMAEGGER